MSPRKTRRRAKSERIDDTLSETISKKSLADASAEQQPKMRTRRRVTKTNKLEMARNQTLETIESKRRTVDETPSKSTRSRKKVPLDNTANDETSAGADRKTRRTGKGKENETLPEQTVLLDDTIVDESSSNVNKLRRTRARKKTAKKDEFKSTEEEAPSDKRINVTVIDGSIASTSNDSAFPMTNEDTEVSQVSRRISRLKSASATAISSGKRRSRNTKLRLEDFTPESSPITINLTPHRATKTPRKSPMNLGSPKSHADAPLRLSKTPRKLPIVVEFPTPSEISVTSSTPNTPEKLTNSKLLESGNTKKIQSPKPKSTKSKAKSRVSASKVKRSSLPKRSTKSHRKRIKSPVVSPTSLESADSSRESKEASSPIRKQRGEATRPRRSGNSASFMSLHLARIDCPAHSPKESKNSSPVLNVQLPTVVLEKISPSSIKTLDIAKRTPAKSLSAEKLSFQGGESPRRPKATGKRSSITDFGTPLRPMDSPRSNESTESDAGKSIVLSSSDTPINIAGVKFGNDSIGPMISSTPRERIRRSLYLSPNLAIHSEIANEAVPVSSSTTILEEHPKRRGSRIDDESNPFINEDESCLHSPTATSRLDRTFEVETERDATIVVENEGDKTVNDTYELAEPKTPNLRRKGAKRSHDDDANTSLEERTVKSACRVRFATSTTNENGNKTIETATGARSRSATPGHRVGLERTSRTHHASSIFGLEAAEGNASKNKSRGRSISMTNVSLLKSPAAGKRRSNSVTDANTRSANRKARNAFVSRLGKPRLSISSSKKTESKTPTARNPPNFAQIHEKTFAKMESLVDAKKRVQERHLAMNSKIPTNLSRVNSKVPTKPAALLQLIDPVNGDYNRFGFKLRKNDAMKIVTQKISSRPSQKRQNDNRQFLKGVRTNRRFELMMKARNINL